MFKFINPKKIQKFYKKYFQNHEIKKINTDIPKLIDFLIMNLHAGVHPKHSIELASQKTSFSKQIRFCLFKISSLCHKGCSFSESIDLVIKDISNLSSHKNLSILLIGVKISFSKGVRGIQMLEKIREKIDDELQFQRKLKVITAQMRMQSNVILFSPIAIFSVLMLIAPKNIYIFFESSFGNFLLIFMIILNLIGYISLKRIINI